MIMRYVAFTLVLFIITWSIYAQSVIDDLESINFTMPSSPAFDLLGVSPSEIHKPGLPRDFQISWLLSGGGLNPNIAIEMEPGWLFFNRSKSRSAYQKSSWLFKTASSLNFSMGTAKVDNEQSLAYGLKLNLYNARDPLLDDALIEQLTPTFTKQEIEYNELLIKLNIASEAAEIDSLNNVLGLLKSVIAEDSVKFRNKSQEVYTNWEKENWNATMLDLGFGQVFNYELPTIFEVVDTTIETNLEFNSKAYAIWLSGVIGLGKKGLINAMAKYTRSTNGNEGIKAGLNARYGNEKINIYTEYIYNTTNNLKSTIVYGADYRLENGFVIQTSLKTMFNNKFELKQLIPTINFAFQPRLKKNGS